MTPMWGPQRIDSVTARFRLWAPDRETLALEIDGGAPIAMRRDAEGWFSVDADAAPGCHYRFRLDEDLAVADPASRAQHGGVHGWSVLHEPDSYAWKCADWTGRPWHEAVIQEVHAGVLGGFNGVAERLSALAELGVTAIQLMPIAAFGGTRNWGYDGVLPFAVAEAYGSPDALRSLINRAHAHGLMVMLDVVYNHFGPDGNYLGAYAKGFFDEHADTPWGGAVAVSQPAVRRFFIENALMWLRDYRFDGLRFDAVHAIADNAFLDEMAREIRAELPGRHIHLVLENENNDADRLGPGLYDAQWNDDFHNVLHVLLTGETDAYYAGFASEPTSRLARCLAEGFIYQGETPPGEGAHPRGTPSAHLPATRFVAFLQNHDQIGNRAMGERLTVLADHDRLRAATALLLLSPQIPLIFMGDEDGSTSPFLFFTDFTDELAEAVREGRRREFASFAAFVDPEPRAAIPDPNAPDTFHASTPKPGADAGSWHALYRDLLAIRHESIVPRLASARGRGADVLGDGAVCARWEMADGKTLTIAVNLGDGEVGFPPAGEPLYALGTAGAPGSFAAWLA
ncbi:malto-oligosyltrehalose trehalohydrolase [Blastomonas sp.]|uniref:malto-oligosyltrehalose trehalohydrolase n=1 Tax=Blastomonas sp. TaxID=1909299 RepID=UPI00391A8339